MSTTKGNNPMNTSTISAAPSGGEETKETKVVETVDYRSSAGQGQQEKKPVEVVHEFQASGNKPCANTKQD